MSWRCGGCCDAGGGTSPTALTETVFNASRVLALTDAGTIMSYNAAAAGVLTIPANVVVAFPAGTVVYFNNLGAGLLSFAAGTNVLHSPYNKIQLACQYAQAMLWCRGADVWQLEGNLA